jgi:hypothetical protein
MAKYTIFEAALEQFGQQIVDQMRATLQRNGNNTGTSGALSNSIQYTIENNKLIISMLEYGKWVNNGAERGSGKKPPIKAIERWILKDSIRPKGKITAKQLPWVIQASIGKNGQTRRRAFPFIQTSYDEVLKTDLNNLFGEAIAKELETAFKKK